MDSCRSNGFSLRTVSGLGLFSASDSFVIGIFFAGFVVDSRDFGVDFFFWGGAFLEVDSGRNVFGRRDPFWR